MSVQLQPPYDECLNIKTFYNDPETFFGHRLGELK